MLRKILGSLALLLFLLSGCKETPTSSILDEVSGVWKPQRDDGLMTLTNSGGTLQLAFDDVLIPVTLGSIDSEQETVNLTVNMKAGPSVLWTLRRIWDKEHKGFHLTLTLHDGKQEEFSFVRKVSTEDMNRIAAIKAKAEPPAQETEHQVVAPAAEIERPVDQQAATVVEADSRGQVLSNYTVSFDCAKASTPVEKIVCSGETIGQLDGLLGATYRERSDPQFGTDPAIMKAGQREWMKKRDACQDEKCVEQAYRDRIKDLCELPVVSGAHPGGDCEQI